MSDIVFIKNADDYYNYKKLKPVKFYSRQKVKFICKSCHKESVKAFYYLTLDFLCGKCKSKQTCKNKYGVENPSQVEEFRQKSKNTCYKNTVLIIIVNLLNLKSAVNKHVKKNMV